MVLLSLTQRRGYMDKKEQTTSELVCSLVVMAIFMAIALFA